MPDCWPVGEILIAGLGSVGRRHLTNLRTLGWTDLRCFRTGRSTLPDLESAGVAVDTDLAEALARRPLAVIVANPTACHLPVALAAARAGAHLFIEKPVADELTGLAELEREVRARRLTAVVGFQFRFHPGLQQLAAWIRSGAIGAIVSAQAHWGEYLPDMHPWEDYRVGYAARPELGGGVLRTLCHPFDYLRWLVGDIVDIAATSSQHNPLGLAVETSVDAVLQFAGGACGHVHLDFVQRPPEHRLTIIGTAGTATWNQADHAARLYSCATGRWEVVSPPPDFERNTMFLDEMRHFLACLRGDAHPACTLADGRAALEAVVAARRAIGDTRLSCQPA